MAKKKKTTRISNINTQPKTEKQKKAKIENGVFYYYEPLTVGDVAEVLGIKSSDIIKKYFLKNILLTINSVLSDDLLGEICISNNLDFNKEILINQDDIEGIEIYDKETDTIERAPVVTIMGHVDHGKTTLIDAIRNSQLASEEVGGISQEIGAYQKVCKGKKITFIDTPGHEAFAAMRARGASVTDIVILVVAADDSVMPQTIEAIDHAKAANVPIMVAINKMDKPGANSDRVKSELMAHGIIPEEYGGENICCEISAKLGTGIDTLLENVIVVSEMLELKSNPERFAVGTVLEARLDKGEGPKATLLVQNGTLKTGDFIVVGTTFGRIRRMSNDHDQVIKEAGPSTPVSIIGLNETPLAGDKFSSLSDEKLAREIASKRKMKKDEEDRRTKMVSNIDELYNKVAEGELTQINIIVKADSTGSAEAVKSSLEKIKEEGIKINVIRASAGAITETDILLASASNAIIYGFNVRPDSIVRGLAHKENIEIRLHRIIYALIEEIEALVKGYRKAEIVEEYKGQAEVRQIFKASKIGTIAGSYVVDGSINYALPVRVLRNGTIVYEGKLSGLKRFKDDAKDVKQGFECGISIENFNDIKEGDIIESYEMVEKKD